jgi:ribosomal protein S27E
MTIDLSCEACGSNRILFNHAASDADEVTCAACGIRVGTFGELKQRVTDQLARGGD